MDSRNDEATTLGNAFLQGIEGQEEGGIGDVLTLLQKFKEKLDNLIITKPAQARLVENRLQDMFAYLKEENHLKKPTIDFSSLEIDRFDGLIGFLDNMSQSDRFNYITFLHKTLNKLSSVILENPTPFSIPSDRLMMLLLSFSSAKDRFWILNAIKEQGYLKRIITNGGDFLKLLYTFSSDRKELLAFFSEDLAYYIPHKEFLEVVLTLLDDALKQQLNNRFQDLPQINSLPELIAVLGFLKPFCYLDYTDKVLENIGQEKLTGLIKSGHDLLSLCGDTICYPKLQKHLNKPLNQIITTLDEVCALFESLHDQDEMLAFLEELREWLPLQNISADAVFSLSMSILYDAVFEALMQLIIEPIKKTIANSDVLHDFIISLRAEETRQLLLLTLLPQELIKNLINNRKEFDNIYQILPDKAKILFIQTLKPKLSAIIKDEIYSQYLIANCNNLMRLYNNTVVANETNFKTTNTWWDLLSFWQQRQGNPTSNNSNKNEMTIAKKM